MLFPSKVTPRANVQAAPKDAYLGAASRMLIGTRSADWKKDDRDIVIAVLGAIACAIGIFVVLFFWGTA